MKLWNFILERFAAFINTGEADSDNPEEFQFFAREKVIAFSIAFFFAVCLWFVVNMNRDYTVTIDVPIELVNLPEELAVSSEVPDHVSVNVSGEGWKLITLYSNPPKVSLSADSRQINLFEQIRNMSGAFAELNVLQVEPIMLTVETEEKAQKKVPVIQRVELNLRGQYGLMGDPEISPDSVTLTGAESKLNEISEWETEEVVLEDVSKSLERLVALKSPGPGITLDFNQIEFRLDVAEFTEAEVRVPVRTRNLPPGKAITFNPSSITVRFDVPIQQFADVQGTRPFSAYVDYTDLEADQSGFITPRVEKVTDDYHVRLRDFQPQRVSYFNIIPD